MKLNFFKEQDTYYRIDNVDEDGKILDFHVASLRSVPGNWIESGSQKESIYWVIYSGRIQFRYDPVASQFATPFNAIDWINRNATGIFSMDDVNSEIFPDASRDKFPENLHHVILTSEEYNDFEVMLENEERTQDEDGGDWSPIIKRFFDK